MHVLTYYQPLPYGQFAHEPELLELWRKRWSALGFTPVVLGPTDLDGEKWSWYSARVATLPTVNPIVYEHACWMRWCAFSDWLERIDPKPEVVLVADYDVFNTGMAPQEFWVDVGRCASYDGQVCGCVRLTAASLRLIPHVLSGLGPHCIGEAYKRPHVSDMYVFVELRRAGWIEPKESRGQIHHLSNDTAIQRRTTKIALWKELEATWPLKTEEACQP